MKTLITAAGLLALASTSAFAWTDGRGHWREGPQLYGPINPGNVYAPYGGPPPAYFYGPPPPAVYGYPGYYAPEPRLNFGIGPGGFFFGLGL